MSLGSRDCAAIGVRKQLQGRALTTFPGGTGSAWRRRGRAVCQVALKAEALPARRLREGHELPHVGAGQKTNYGWGAEEQRKGRGLDETRHLAPVVLWSPTHWHCWCGRARARRAELTAINRKALCRTRMNNLRGRASEAHPPTAAFAQVDCEGAGALYGAKRWVKHFRNKSWLDQARHCNAGTTIPLLLDQAALKTGAGSTRTGCGVEGQGPWRPGEHRKWCHVWRRRRERQVMLATGGKEHIRCGRGPCGPARRASQRRGGHIDHHVCSATQMKWMTTLRPCRGGQYIAVANQACGATWQLRCMPSEEPGRS